MAEHPIQGLMGVTIEKIRDMVNAETIIGDPIHVDDTTIIPVSRVTFGFVSGGSAVDNVIASLPELVDMVAALIKKEKPGADAPAE